MPSPPDRACQLIVQSAPSCIALRVRVVSWEAWLVVLWCPRKVALRSVVESSSSIILNEAGCRDWLILSGPQGQLAQPVDNQKVPRCFMFGGNYYEALITCNGICVERNLE